MDAVRKRLEELKIEGAEEKCDLLRSYMEMVLERNRQVNLTAITDEGEFIEKHYLDSLAAGDLPEFTGASSVLDLGTGGGFPGIPLAVAYPDKDFVLVDSLGKRIRIIREFCRDLGISNVTAIHGRAEDLGREADLREAFDACVSRAVADLRILAEYCLPFVRPGGWFLAYKGGDCHEEIRGAVHAIKTLGGEIHRTVPAAGHQIILIRKVREISPGFPRRPGVPGKKPL